MSSARAAHRYPRIRQITGGTVDGSGFWETTSGGSTFFTSAGSTIPITHGSSSTSCPPSTTSSFSSRRSASTSSGSTQSSTVSSSSLPTTSSGFSTSSGSSSTSSSSTNPQTSSTFYPITTTFTTSTPVTTVTQASTTFTSYSSFLTSSIIAPASSPSSIFAAQGQPVCIGSGVDALSTGLIETICISSVIGLLLWLLFAIIRPRFRQIYASREWFPQQNLRPRPLGDNLWAFLFPHVPLVPSMPKDVSDAGRSPATDAELFPSDEQLSQRTLWIAFLIVLGWSFIGLVAALPLYMVSTPCMANSAPRSRYLGVYSTLQDLSLLRLLQAYDQGNITTSGYSLTRREIVNGDDLRPNARVRLIILTVILIVLAVIPGVWKILREFNKVLAYRRRWLDVRCAGMDMGWLSARQAPGFVGWGEKRLKEFIIKTGLSSSLETDMGPNEGNGNRRRRRNPSEVPLTRVEEEGLEVDIQGLFSIGDTRNLAVLIDERDEILENLEVAETRYISSFRLSTPDPSIADLEPVKEEEDETGKKYISRPLPLGVASARRRNRARNPAYASSSLTPTAYLAPQNYYKLGEIRGVSHSPDASRVYPSLSDSINQRVVGSRFQEMSGEMSHHSLSPSYGKLPLGSHVKLGKSGELRRVESHATEMAERIPDPARYGPNADPGAYSVDDQSTPGDKQASASGSQSMSHYRGGSEMTEEVGGPLSENGQEDQDWVDVNREPPINSESDDETQHRAASVSYSTSPGTSRSPGTIRSRGGTVDYMSEFGMRPASRISKRTPRPAHIPPMERRETFPLRNKSQSSSAEQQAPHLRLQTHGPFVRPVTGLDHEHLGAVYTDISHWRTQLKTINQEIAEAQREGYNDIADGTRIKGWLMVGRGLRFVPGLTMIEGRAKEDIRWDELQYEVGTEAKLFGWVGTAMATVILAAALTAVAGLALGTAPEFAHYFPFFRPLADRNDWISGFAVCLAPAVAATLFICVAVVAVHYTAQLSGAVSISGLEMATFKMTFFILTVVGAIWLMTIGAILFAMDAWSIGSGRTRTVANGSIYMSMLALMLITNIAIISPALLMLQPSRLLRIPNAVRNAITPRQRFRAVYPRTYSTSFATGCCVLAIVFASTFSLIFPLIGPAVVVLLFLTLIAHRYLVGYVYGRTRSQTGGLLQLWLLKRFGVLVAFQPFLLGLIFLTRRLWPEAGVLLAAAFVVVLLVEGYTAWKTRLPGLQSLSAISRNSLDTFEKQAQPLKRRDIDEESTSLVSSSNRQTRMRGSFASVLEMMSVTLAVAPAPSRQGGPVPLPTETIDDLTATERAARTHADGPPLLPLLPFADHAQEVANVLYAPELLAPDPIIWLPNDSSGIARSEARDLDKYHHLKVTLDVRTQDDVLPRRWSSQRGASHTTGL